MRRVLGCVEWCWQVGLGSSVGYEEGFWDVRVVLGVGARWWRVGRGRRVEFTTVYPIYTIFLIISRDVIILRIFSRARASLT